MEAWSISDIMCGEVDEKPAMKEPAG